MVVLKHENMLKKKKKKQTRIGWAFYCRHKEAFGFFGKLFKCSQIFRIGWFFTRTTGTRHTTSQMWMLKKLEETYKIIIQSLPKLLENKDLRLLSSKWISLPALTEEDETKRASSSPHARRGKVSNMLLQRCRGRGKCTWPQTATVRKGHTVACLIGWGHFTFKKREKFEAFWGMCSAVCREGGHNIRHIRNRTKGAPLSPRLQHGA